jgi:hypothetical protein
MEYGLNPGERLLWTGAPPRGVRFTAADVLLVPFSLLWAGFAFFWEASVLASPDSRFMGLWGIPFCAAGVYIVFGRFFADAWRRGRTEYAVTSERAIVVEGSRVTSYDLVGLSGHSVDERKDGSGTIWLAPRPPFGVLQNTTWPSGRSRRVPSFDSIPDVGRVYRILTEAQRRRLAAPAGEQPAWGPPGVS